MTSTLTHPYRPFSYCWESSSDDGVERYQDFVIWHLRRSPYSHHVQCSHHLILVYFCPCGSSSYCRDSGLSKQAKPRINTRLLGDPQSLDWGSRGRRFKSGHPDNYFTPNAQKPHFPLFYKAFSALRSCTACLHVLESGDQNAEYSV
jgi:hypothetical protein